MQGVFARVLVLIAIVVPVPGPVVQRFVAPACERCAGHRGVTIASGPGLVVRAPAAGVVSFAGDVAGSLYVVIAVDQVGRATAAPAVKVTVGRLAVIGPDVLEGVRLAEGQEIGKSGPLTHLSVRVKGVHVEPLLALGLGWVRLRGPGGVLVGRRAVPR